MKKKKRQPKLMPAPFNIGSGVATSIMKHVTKDVKFIEQADYPPITKDDEWYPVISKFGEPLLYNKTHKYYMTSWGWKLPKEMFE